MNRARHRGLAAARAAVRRGRAATSRSASNSSRPRPRRWKRRCGSRSRRWSRSRRASSRSPMAPAARPASAPTRPWRGSCARPASPAAAHLTCVEREPRTRSTTIARAYWEAGVRHIVALRGDPPEQGAELRAASRRLCQCRRAGRRAEEGGAVRDLGRRLSRMPSGFAERRRRSRQSQAQDRRRRRPGDHPVLLRSPNASSASATRPPRPGSTSRSCPASCRSPTSPRSRKMAAMCGAAIPAWLGPAVRGARRPARRAPAGRRHGRRRAVRPALCRRRPPVPLLHAEPRRAGLRDLPPARRRPGADSA